MTFRRWKIQGEDRTRYSPFVRNLMSRLLLRRSLLDLERAVPLAVEIEHLCTAARLAGSEELVNKAEAMIKDRLFEAQNSGGLQRLLPGGGGGSLIKTLILKPFLGGREKGVILMPLADQCAQLTMLPNLKEFNEEYSLVLTPTWSPPHSLINYVFPRLFPGPLITLISNQRDLEYFPRLSENYRPLPLFASNWVDPDLFEPVPFVEKKIDILMVANFGKFKRHHCLFRALRGLPRETRVVLVGQHDMGRHVEDVKQEARAFGVEDRFELIEHAPYSQISTLFATAKISLILSKREGSCVAVAESMLAGTPVGIFEDAEVGSRVFVNEKTGRFLKHEDLAQQLTKFLDEAAAFAPREWAMQSGIGCRESSQKLNTALKAIAEGSGADWTRDIAPHRWTPYPTYSSAEDANRLAGAYDTLQTRFGLHVGGFTRD